MRSRHSPRRPDHWQMQWTNIALRLFWPPSQSLGSCSIPRRRLGNRQALGLTAERGWRAAEFFLCPRAPQVSRRRSPQYSPAVRRRASPGPSQSHCQVVDRRHGGEGVVGSRSSHDRHRRPGGLSHDRRRRPSGQVRVDGRPQEPARLRRLGAAGCCFPDTCNLPKQHPCRFDDAAGRTHEES
jgi:hypothetical protein